MVSGKSNVAFGSELAEHDPLLFDCYVTPPGDAQIKPLLVGKWGTGKTATILKKGENLRNALVDVHWQHEHDWFIVDEEIFSEHFFPSFSEYAEQPQAIESLMEKLWTAEISRRVCRVLSVLWEYYGKPEGRHWSAVKKIHQFHEYTESIWRILPNALTAITSKTYDNDFKNLKREIDTLLSNQSNVHIRECIRGIPDGLVRPMIAIEPIETPTSPMESHPSLAQTMVNSLLNVYRKKFHAYQEIEVHISLPWHRYRKKSLPQPHKYAEVLAFCTWSYSSIRNFINQRIEWEFRRVRRQFSKKGGQEADAWATLFGLTVRNEHCVGGIEEDTYNYVLRHTHYRARDFQRLARKIVEFQATLWNVDVDDVLLGRGGRRITSKAIVAAIRAASRDTARDRIIESERRFPGIERKIEALRGIQVPFEFDELRRRVGETKETYAEFMHVVDELWQSGIIGLEVSPTSDDQRTSLKKHFAKDAERTYKNTKGEMVRYFYFEFNSYAEIGGLLKTVFEGSHGQIKYILHPMMFESLGALTTTEYPIGV